ncbi:MAG: CopD family protein [Gammaproteobacteria bacterium]|nr:CopD family protein [Gammaproteobacteria bacterium]MBU1603590.1 CopD family protein [Gammaproteobacteria bacterium]MBU2432387.1 CopD family protein [Gammaproteobacteria bacterium]MBU2447729.1 CopD family protein [Gammaproteobacteria bacterium]
MLVVKTLHIWMVISWFAGLFYLPRIFVNLAMVPDDSVAERDRLLLMAGKLYKFMTPLGVFAVLTGLWLWIVYGNQIALGGWIHAKTTLVAVLAVFHWHCGRVLKQFQGGGNKKTHIWFRFYNELPVIVLLFVLFLVVLKPF